MTAVLKEPDILAEIAPVAEWVPPPFKIIGSEYFRDMGWNSLRGEDVRLYRCDNRDWVAVFDDAGNEVALTSGEYVAFLDEIHNPPEPVRDPFTEPSLDDDLGDKRYHEERELEPGEAVDVFSEWWKGKS